ncbi:hypothetical protein GCM10022251_75270 [Phytohabitans flavus]|uniref:Uncharacterized protein n=1 Tax=Phytohabitans flavus TaxID=1076124 RepID=A0A6F8XME0_9ACTN|nr:hypothetical protein Pflav_013680 [Phytohabitans flavus]
MTQWTNELGLWLAYETLAPAFGNALAAEGQLSGKLQIPDSVGRIVLSLYPISMDATSVGEGGDCGQYLDRAC